MADRFRFPRSVAWRIFTDPRRWTKPSVALPAAVQEWFAATSADDARARLVEAGADADAQVMLGDVFVDLPALPMTVRGREEETESGLQAVLGTQLSGPPDQPVNEWGSAHLLLIGGPGEGKSSLTAMAALLLRDAWIEDALLSEKTRKAYTRARESLKAVRESLEGATLPTTVPLRVDLPTWASARKPGAETVWHLLSQQIAQRSGNAYDVALLEARMREAAPLLWLFDGLDEVVRGPTRDAMVREIIALAQRGDRVVVTTRPQGYEDEFAGMGELVLQPLGFKLAKEMSERLVRGWLGSGSESDAALKRVREAFSGKVAMTVAHTPLHVTLVTLVALTNALPSNRAALFELFFETLFKREINKRGAADVRLEDQGILRRLHARIALVLQARSADDTRANVKLSADECRALLVGLLLERGLDDEQARRRADVLIRFSRERLVLLRRLHSDGFGFGIRSFQEYFAAIALLDEGRDTVVQRLRAVALDKYFTNVVELAVCELVRRDDRNGIELATTVLLGVLDALAGLGDERLALGARVAAWWLEVLNEVDVPWVQRPLFDRALASAREADVFDSEFYEGLFTANDLYETIGAIVAGAACWISIRPTWVSAVVRAAARAFGDNRARPGWTLLAPLLSKNEPEAELVAQQFEPTTKEAARVLTQFARPQPIEDQDRWWREFIAKRWRWFPPAILGYGDATVAVTSKPSATSVNLASGIVFQHEVIWTAMGIDTSRILPLEPWSDADRALAGWDIVAALEGLALDRSAERVASLLRLIAAAPPELADARYWSTCVWYVGSAVRWAGSPPRLRELADRIERGEVSVPTDLNNERRFATVAEMLESDWSDRAPWPDDISTRGLPLLNLLLARSSSPTPLPRAERCTPLTYELARVGAIEPFAPEVVEAFLADRPWLREDPPAPRPPPSPLAQIVAAHQGSLLRDEAWQRLKLPGLSPERAARRTNPLVIESIDTLSGLRAFAETPEVRGALPVPEHGRGQWIVLLGENGAGKSTLLRALALALLDQDTATKLLTARLRLLRNGVEGRVRVTMNKVPFECRVRKNEDNEEAVETISADPLHKPWVVGYGVRRSTALGEPDRSAELRGVANLHSLFELPSSLVHAPTWLDKQRKLVLSERGKNVRDKLEPEYKGPDERAWDAICVAFERILGITEIDADGRELYVRHPSFGRVRFDQLSDGYLTTAGWLVDLVARWIAHHANESMPDDVLASMTGLVLVDEIDLHLHPLWQMRIIDDVRRLFPKMSFVVTTHNPLTVHGARPGEVFVMHREQGSGESTSSPRVVIEQRDVMPGSDIDRVLLDLFDVRDTLDSATRALLDEHMALLRKGVPDTDPQRQTLEAQIRSVLGAGGGSLVDQRSRRIAPEGKMTDEGNAFAEALLGREIDE